MHAFLASWAALGTAQVSPHTISTRNNLVAAREKELWIGMVEVRLLNRKSKILGDAKGAFVNIVTWASDAAQYRRNVEVVIGSLGDLFVSDVVNLEPVETRRARTGGFEDDVEDMILRAQGNQDAIIYGTFHTYAKDNA